MKICGFGGFSGPWPTARRDECVSCSTYGGVGRYKLVVTFEKCKKVAQKWSKVHKTGRNSIFGVPMDIFSGFIQQYSPKAEEETEFKINMGKEGG